MNPMTTDLEEDEVRPLSGKPYFHLILAKTHLEPLYHMFITKKMDPVLPSAIVPLVLTCRGKNYETVYYGENGRRRIDIAGWKNFAIDNDLKVGDACVFEVMECSSTKLKFSVQVLSGEFPSQLLEKNGQTLDSPIMVE